MSNRKHRSIEQAIGPFLMNQLKDVLEAASKNDVRAMHQANARHLLELLSESDEDRRSSLSPEQQALVDEVINGL